MQVPLARGLATGTMVLLGLAGAQSTAHAAGADDIGRTADSHASKPSTALQRPQLAPALAGTTGALGYAVHPVKVFRLDPLADSSADPLSNGVALQPDAPGDTPLSSTLLTDSLSNGGGLADLPLAGRAVALLPG
jgi:hypothetical protein